MKVIWDADDIRPGMRVRTPGCNETWMIGYDPSIHGEKTPALAIISLADGAICQKGCSPGMIADFLNTAGNQPIVLLDSI